jgi:hypothetical protein
MQMRVLISVLYCGSPSTKAELFPFSDPPKTSDFRKNAGVFTAPGAGE